MLTLIASIARMEPISLAYRAISGAGTRHSWMHSVTTHWLCLSTTYVGLQERPLASPAPC